MASPLELLNQASYNSRRRGVTYMPPVRIQPPVKPGPPITPRLAPQQQFGQGGGDWVTPNFDAMKNLAAPPPAAGKGPALGGLGFLINNPVTKTAFNALSVLDYPAAAVIGGERELLDVLNLAEGGKDTGWDWNDLWKNIKGHKHFGELIVEPALGKDSNIWLRRGLGFAGDVLSDPLTYLLPGAEAMRGAPARAEYLTKLRGAQEAATAGVGHAEQLIESLPRVLETAGPTMGYGGMARQKMAETLAGAEQRLPGLLEQQAALGDNAVREQIGRRGVNIASPAQMEAMGIPGHAVRARLPIGGRAWEIPGTEGLSRAMSRVGAPIKERLSQTAAAKGWRKLFTPAGEFRQSMIEAMNRIVTGEGAISMDEALNTVRLDQWAREGGGAFRNPATRVLNAASKSLGSYSQDQIDNMVHALETQGDNITVNAGEEALIETLSGFAPAMDAAAREAGVRIPLLQGGKYVMPHALSRESFNFMKNLREGQNPLVDAFKRKLRITDEDLLEEGGFLQKRIFRPNKDGTPLKFKIGKGADAREVVIKDGSLRELEEQLGGVLREAGFKGKLYETNPIEAWKKYIVATEKDVAKRYAGRRGAMAGMAGLHMKPGELPPEYFDPVEMQTIFGREGQPARQVPVDVGGKPVAPEHYEYRETKASQAATEARNQRIMRKPKKGKGTGTTPVEILADYREAAGARRANLAERMDKLATETWQPIIEERWKAREGTRLTGHDVRDALAEGKKINASASEAQAALESVDQEIATLQRRIAGTQSGAKRRITAVNERAVADMLAETHRLGAEREQLMSAYLDDLGDLPQMREQAAARAESWVGARTEAETSRLSKEAKESAADLRRQRRAVSARRREIHDRTWVNDRELDNAKKRIRDSPGRNEYDALHEQLREQERKVARLQEAEQEFTRRGDKANQELQQVNVDDIDAQIAKYNEAKAHFDNADRIERELTPALDQAEALKTKIDDSKFMRDVRIATRGEEQRATIENWTGSLVEGGPHYDIPAAKRRALKARVEHQEWTAARERDPGIKALQAMTPEQRAAEEAARMQRSLETPEGTELKAATERLPKVQEELGKIEPPVKPQPVPEMAWSGGKGSYEYKTTEGALIARIEKQGKEWMTFYGDSQHPEGVFATMRDARSAVEKTIAHQHQQEQWRYQGALRRQRGKGARLTAEQEQLQRLAESKPALGSRIEQAKAAATRSEQMTGDAAARAQAEAFVTSETGRTVEAAKRVQGSPNAAAAKKAKSWLTRNKESVARYEESLATLSRSERMAGELPPIPTRDPRIELWEQQAEQMRGQAKDLLGQQAKIEQRYIPQLPEAVRAEHAAAGAAAEATTRTTPEAIAAEVAADPQTQERLTELRQAIEAQGAKGEAAQQQLDEASQAIVGWHNDYARALRDQGEARAIHEDLVSKTEKLQRPQSAEKMVEGARQAKPYGKRLEQVRPRPTPAEGGMAPGRMWAAGGARITPDGPMAYELQPLNRTIQDTSKLVAANPLGDDAEMNRIEALLHQHEQELASITREGDLPAHQLDQVIRSAKDGSLGDVLQLQLADGLKYLVEGGDVIISKEAQRIYFNASKQLQSKLLGRYFTLYTDFFKTYATGTPGFHLRNAMSAFFMNSSEGITLPEQISALRLWRRYAKAADPVQFLRDLPDAERAAFRATFGSGAGGQFLETGVSELRAGQTKAFEKVFANRYTRWNQKVGQDWVEGPARLALALDTTRRGGDVIDAMNRVTRIHFDYGQISQFDEKMKRIIPFWTFMSRNMPLQFTQMWTKPRAYAHYAAFARNFQLGATAPEFLPNYITQEGGLVSGGTTPDWLPLAGKGMPIMLQPGMPFLQAQGDVKRWANALSGGPGGLAQVLSDVNPALTALPQYALAKDFFTGRSYGPQDQTKAKGLNVPIALALSLVGGAQRGADGNLYISENAYDNLKGLIPVLDRQSRLLPQATGESSDRQLEGILRFLGVPVRTVSEDQMRGEAFSRAKTQRNAAELARATGG